LLDVIFPHQNLFDVMKYIYFVSSFPRYNIGETQDPNIIQPLPPILCSQQNPAFWPNGPQPVYKPILLEDIAPSMRIPAEHEEGLDKYSSNYAIRQRKQAQRRFAETLQLMKRAESIKSDRASSVEDGFVDLERMQRRQKRRKFKGRQQSAKGRKKKRKKSNFYLNLQLSFHLMLRLNFHQT